MTDKQVELFNKAKAVLRILSPLSEGDRQAVTMIVFQLTDAENRLRMEAEKLAYASQPREDSITMINQTERQSPMGGGLFRG